MFTLFDCFQIMGLAVAALAGLAAGHQLFGIVGAIAGTLLGLVVGAIVGRLPFVVAFGFLRRDLRNASTSSLRDRLQRQYYISHLIIAELVVRGEPVEGFREIVRAQLDSPSADERRFGSANADLWFPDLANRRSNWGGVRGEEAAFLAAILENPQDRGLRHVYADWLEERGDPRADCLRLDPASLSPARFKSLCRDFDLEWVAVLNAGLRRGDVVEILDGVLKRMRAEVQEVDLGRGIARVRLPILPRQPGFHEVKLSEVCRVPGLSRSSP
jgi:uncharacterized protein (TIGR02996 family)